MKELLFQQEENKKNHDRITDLVEKLQQKIKSYKKQIEDAEEIAALNLAKFRKAQQDYEEAEERSKICEANIFKYKNARGFSSTPGPVIILTIIDQVYFDFLTRRPININSKRIKT